VNEIAPKRKQKLLYKLKNEVEVFITIHATNKKYLVHCKENLKDRKSMYLLKKK